MALAPKFNQVVLGTGETSILLPSGAMHIVQSIDIANTTGVDKTFRLFAILTAATAGSATNAFFYDVTVPANGTINYAGPLNIPDGGELSGLASANPGVTVTVSYLEKN